MTIRTGSIRRGASLILACALAVLLAPPALAQDSSVIVYGGAGSLDTDVSRGAPPAVLSDRIPAETGDSENVPPVSEPRNRTTAPGSPDGREPAPLAAPDEPAAFAAPDEPAAVGDRRAPLPFTGLAVGLIAGAGLLLTGAGLSARRLSSA